MNDFVNEKIKSLNIITIPYNSSQILERVIHEAWLREEKILYISNEAETDIDILKFLSEDIEYFIYKGKSKVNDNFIISNYYNAKKLKNKFDLIIYNDIRSCPEVNSYEIIDLLDILIKSQGRILYFGVEGILKNSKDIVIPVRDSGLPMFEPKFITTRVDISKDIPFVIFEYIKWSLKSKRKVIIYTPDSYRTKEVYNYMNEYIDKLTNNIYGYIDSDSIDEVKSFAHSLKAILITNDFKELGINMQDCDVMVFFADDLSFNYKRLLFLSCKGIRFTNKYNGEVIFLSKQETTEMNKTRDMIRRFNKQAWEEGLLI